ncbi:ATP-binding protein [Embleya sp. NPDC059259]|uniref:ATP-binding protein n=1 Tax=unclassified Embleya TaxID=2699296 RepID=UPI0036A7AEF5
MHRRRRSLLRWRVPRRIGASARARTAVGAALADWGWDGDGVAAAVLVLSELLTNAQLHTDGDVVLAVRRTGRGARLSVTDTDPRMPTRRDTGSEHEGGFGLHILDTLTTDWGVRARRAGKTVWADIDGPAPARAVVPVPVRARSGAASIGAALHRVRRAGLAGLAAARRGARPPRSQVWAWWRVGAIGSSVRAGTTPLTRRIRRMRRGSSHVMLVHAFAAA